MFPSFHFVPLLSSFFPRARSSLFPNAEDSRLRLTVKPPLGTGYIHTGYVCIQSKAWANLVTQSHSLNPEGRRKIEVDSASERPPSETGTPIKGAPRQVSVMANSCRGHNEISLCVWFVLPLRERKVEKEEKREEVEAFQCEMIESTYCTFLLFLSLHSSSFPSKSFGAEGFECGFCFAVLHREILGSRTPLKFRPQKSLAHVVFPS